MFNLFNLLAHRCPECGGAPMFKHPLYKFWKFSQMHSHCPKCNCDFEPEPGFYYGAMYISYALNVAIFAIVFTSLYFIVGSKNPVDYLAPVIGTLLFFMPWTFRQSRALMLHLFRPRQSKD